MATLNIRMDDKVKEKFEEFCSSVGMNMTTAINIFATTVIREQRIPFEISNDPLYNSENIQRLLHAIEKVNAGQGVSKTMEELEAYENE